MKRARALLLFCLVYLVTSSSNLESQAQSSLPKPAVPPTSDYSKEAEVGELQSTKIAFENDGTYTQESRARVRIQSTAALQAYGMIKFSYASQSSDVDIDYVRVLKPDGRVIETPKENILDMPSEVMQAAPFYSDQKEKRVAVKGLEVGDRVEYSAHWKYTKPLVPGQFWYAYEPEDDAILLDEELEISVPATRALKLKSGSHSPTIENRGDYQVYFWKFANTVHKSEERKKEEALRQIPPVPTIMLTSFQSWDEVGAWFRGLATSKVAVTPEIQAKARELTQSARSDDEKIRAIYSYVSTKYRYIGIAFGIGRYQPHSANEVLANGYGDCKDKHTLLAALLEAADVHAEAALLNSNTAIELDIPSPGQFDHVVTVVPRGSNLLWLDATEEISPAGFLIAALRDKSALEISSTDVRMVKTPADPPFLSYFSFKVKGAINEKGTLIADVETEFRGDTEYALRAAFRQASQATWTDVVQNISKGIGFGGTVSNVSVGDPEVTDKPFRIAYHYVRENYSDWENHRIGPPFPPIVIPVVQEEELSKSSPVRLGSPIDVTLDATIKLPDGFTPGLPSRVSLDPPFGSYHSVYEITDQILHARRTLSFLKREVPPEQRADYESFQKRVFSDEDAMVLLYGHSSTATNESSPSASDAQANYQEAQRILRRRLDIQRAIDPLKAAVAIDPKFVDAWVLLAQLQASMQPDEAAKSLQKALELNPNPAAVKSLGFSFLGQNRNEEAITAFRKLEELNPSDADAPANIGSALIRLKRYQEAVVELEEAVKKNPRSALIELRLGDAYARSGAPAKATETFHTVLELERTAGTLNEVAYEMAETNINLTEALQDAKECVDKIERQTEAISLDDLESGDLTDMVQLGAYWDTLGWVEFKLGNFSEAENFLKAAWNLTQAATEADHLGQLYEKQGKTKDAIHMYALAAGSVPGGASYRPDLDRLAPNRAAASKMENDARGELSKRRSISLPRHNGSKGTAEIFVLFTSDGSIKATKFISGPEQMKPLESEVKSAKFNVLFPDAGPERIVRRVITVCTPPDATCEFVLMTPDVVRTVN